jgi:5-formyltetrahydrofolate cyclo-ligase
MRELPTLNCVAGYLAKVEEPNIDEVLAHWQSAGTTVYLPRVQGSHLIWVAASTLDDLANGAFGVREPQGDGTSSLPTVDAIVMPALAVDRQGYRLGQGGGYYDRALADVATYQDGGPLRIAVINADEFLTSVPRESHDVRVDVVCMASGVHWIDESATPAT